ASIAAPAPNRLANITSRTKPSTRDSSVITDTTPEDLSRAPDIGAEVYTLATGPGVERPGFRLGFQPVRPAGGTVGGLTAGLGLSIIRALFSMAARSGQRSTQELSLGQYRQRKEARPSS